MVSQKKIEKARAYLLYLLRLKHRQTALDLCDQAILYELQVTVPKVLACLEDDGEGVSDTQA